MPEINLPKYLYKKTSNLSLHVSPYAKFDPLIALDGKQAFVSTFSPNQQPQKKQIYLDFKTFYKLWDSENRALIIAKLKQEKFSVFLICQKNKPDEPILAEIDDELNLKIKGVKKSIFLLNDDDIQGLSSIDHSLAINKLSLAIDDSVILDFAQFKEIGDVLGVNSWVEKGVFKSHLRLSSFKGLEEFEITKTNSLIKKNIHLPSFDTGDFPQMMLNYFQLPDFDLEDKEVKILLNFLADGYELPSGNEYYSFSFAILNDLLKVIYKDNPETVKKIFNYWFEYQFKPEDDAKKIAFQKFLIKSFWFFYPDFSELIDKAKSIDEYSHSSIDEIADSLIQPSIDNLIDLHNPGGFYLKEPDLERLSEALCKHIIKKYIDVAKFQCFRNKTCDFLMIFSKYIEDFKIFVDREKILFTVNGENIIIDEIHIEELLNNETTNNKFNIDNLIRIKIENLIQDLDNDNTGFCDFRFYHDDLYTFLCNYFDFLSIQNQEKLILKLQLLIDDKEISFNYFTILINKLDRILTNPKIIKKLNISSIIKFLIEDIYQQYSFSYKEYSIIIKLLQHNLEKESNRLDLIKILEKASIEFRIELNFDLTPEFEDLFVKLYQQGKIDIIKFDFPISSSISKKIWSQYSLIERELYIGGYKVISMDFYLANYASNSLKYKTQLPEISSQQLNQSPIQFYLVDLNQKSLAEIKDLISKQKIDPSKILSLNILGFNQVELARKLKVEDDSHAINPILKQQLLTEVINLFPNLKHLRLSKVFSLEETRTAIAGKKIVREFIDYMPENIRTNLETITTSPLVTNVSQNDNIISIANQLSDNKANKSGNPSHTMLDVGKILSRPQTKTHSFLVRDSLSTLKTNCHSLEEDWLPKDNSTRDLQKVLKISKFSIDQFNSFSPDQGLLSTHSFCSFTQDLDSGNNSLLSISPDNEIVGYYTDSDDKDIKFHKNDQGFFFVTCTKKCQITYILKGQELPYKSLKDVSLDLPDSIKKVITDYRGLNPDQFPFAIQETDYKLPEYSDDASIDIQQKNKQWLDQLFSIPNKGACRHRVMAMAHKFQQANLVNGGDFRIVGVNNNHILLEVKNRDDSWITLDLGGSNAQLNYQSGTYRASTVTLDNEEELQSEKDILTVILDDKLTGESKIPPPSPSKPQAKVVDQELQSVQTEIDKLYQLKELNTLNQFQTELLGFIDSQQKSLLLTSLTIEKLKNYLLGFKKTDESISTHFISSPQDMQIQKATIQIQSSEKVSISPTTALWQFIETAKSKPSEKHFLIIDWQKFDDKSRVAFNTMFDQSKRTINGVEIPDNLKIICLDDARSRITDPSILSRFDIAYDVSTIQEKDLVGNQAISLAVAQILEFDGQGEENWQAKLFGKLVVNGQLIEFKKSEFTRNLDLITDGSIEFSFKNFSTKQQDEIAKLFAQAQAQGFIDYHGYKINFPKNYSLQFDRAEFNFAEILQYFKSSSEIADGASLEKLNLVIHKNSQPITDDVKIVNSYLFDQLLAIPEITNNQYHEQPGLIESAKGQTLKLFITEQLTPAQLYCLMFNAKKHGVSLELYLAKDVKFEDQVFSKFNKTSATPQADLLALTHSSSPSRITITNDVEQEFNNLKEKLILPDDTKHKKINIVNIEDVLFSDLFSKTEFKLKVDNQSEHFTFEEKISEVKKKLDAQEIVVLKGKFPKDLLSLLHPQILDLKKQYPNLYFIIEEQEISSTSKASTQLAWLDRSKYAIKHHPNQAVEKPVQEIEKTACINPEISDNSLQEALDFINNRKAKLKELLSNNSVLQIIGHSGVGKSSLLREVKRNGFVSATDAVITEELENFEQWANDRSDKTKILVIDEFNVDGSTNFTMFRDLVNAKDDSRRKIFYQGKFYQLDQHHKVVFLGNPHNYGNRHKHQLFSDCQIQEWRLADFSQSYIYQKILKEPIFDGLSEDFKSKLNEEEFKELSAEAIRKYYENNTKKSDDESDLPLETVRELQERVLQEIVKKHTTSLKTEVANQNFISSQANQKTIRDLQTAVKIRQLQKQGDFPSESLGTPGVIFEGDSGVGKSVMIEAVLQNQGITALSSLDDLAIDDRDHHYFKIDASSPYQKIKEQLFKAFELGVIVVIDELNTRINEGLEKEINALLTGQHPEKPGIKMKPGFMIITSVNKASSAGRANFSLAIKHRCTNISAPHLKQYQVDDIVEIMVNWIEKNPSIQAPNLGLVKTIAQKFQQLAKQDPKYNLRSLKTKFNEIKHALFRLNAEYCQDIQFKDPNLEFRYFHNNPQLNFFAESRTNVLDDLDCNRLQNSCFHFLNKNFDQSQPQKINPKEHIFQALKTSRDQLEISEDDMIQFSILAVKHQGLGNAFNNQRTQGLIQEDFQKLFGENWQEKKSQAIKFSAIFQKKLFEQNILTGRANFSREVGMRLKRLDPELLLEFLVKDQKLDIKKELIKDNFINKLNKILKTSNQSLEESIKTLITNSNNRQIIAR